MHILCEQGVLRLQSQPVAVDREVTPKPHIDPPHSPYWNELQTSADVHRIGQQVVEQPGAPHPACLAVSQELAVEPRVRHTVPAQSVSAPHERLECPSCDVVVPDRVLARESTPEKECESVIPR